MTRPRPGPGKNGTGRGHWTYLRLVAYLSQVQDLLKQLPSSLVRVERQVFGTRDLAVSLDELACPQHQLRAVHDYFATDTRDVTPDACQNRRPPRMRPDSSSFVGAITPTVKSVNVTWSPSAT
jgi:hypothetical protein